MAEVGVVAEKGERDDAGEDHRAEDLAAGSLLDRTREFLEREDDAGERRVERRGDAGGATGEDELAPERRVAERKQPPARVEHARADLHRRPLAAEHEAGAETG